MSKSKYLSFPYAKLFAKALGLKTRVEWYRYVNGEYQNLQELPVNVPIHPQNIYKNKGWSSWNDWLNSDYVVVRHRFYLPFKEARDFVRSLKIEYATDYKEYVMGKVSGLPFRPLVLPYSPDVVYINLGWRGWKDWLGDSYRGRTGSDYLSYTEARKFVRSLKFKTANSWVKYRSKHKDLKIPYFPKDFYKDSVWNGWKDFLGKSYKGKLYKTFLPFKEAREIVRSLGLSSSKEWIQYKKENQIKNIPVSPHYSYKETGWKNWGDWLGENYVARTGSHFLSFKQARKIARSLNLRTSVDWCKYKTKHKPRSLPLRPELIYKNSGWSGWKDFLGERHRGGSKEDFLPFKEARRTVRSLKLKSSVAYRSYKTKHKPENLPADPFNTYKNDGWQSWKDFLGKSYGGEVVSPFLSFNDAKKLVQSCGIKTMKEFRDCKKKQRLGNIPYNPDISYKKKDWVSWDDFLGRVSKKGRKHSNK